MGIITVEIHRGTIDPIGMCTDAEVQTICDHVLDVLRGRFPGAEIRAVGPGGRTSGTDESGRDVTVEVQRIVESVLDEWCTKC